MATAANTESLYASARCWNAGDLDGYLTIYAPTIVHHGLDPRGSLDSGGNRQNYEHTYAAFAGSTLTVEMVVADGDLLASRFRLVGVHVAEFMGIAMTGRRIDLRGQNMMRFVNGKVVERWTVADVSGLLHQLGATNRSP